MTPRLEIQGLRAVAVFAVLFYHLWDSTFKIGFLGVDTFFVISGYLMTMILTKTRPNISTILDFYFRRLKRIVPLFLFVVFCTLLTCIFLIAPIEFSNLSMDALVSSVFLSNYLNIHSSGYFDLYGEFAYFKHAWSLAVELQFYILVPLIFYLFSFLDRFNVALKFCAIGVVSLVSFILQTISSPNAAHMHLHNRLWQFICGFFAYYVHNEDLSRFYKKKERLIFIASESFNFLLFFLLLVCMFTNFIDVIQISRFFVVFITTLILSKRTASIFLSLDAVVLIGDISYSIYLIHWPIFTLHRYWFVDAYFDRNTHPTFIAGIQLILCTIVLAYVVEKLYKFIGQQISNWLTLYVVLLLSYAFVMTAILYICRERPVYTYDSYMALAQQNQADSHITHLYETQQNESDVNVSEINMEIHVFSTNFYACRNRSRILPISNHINLNYFSSFCHDRGTGNKTILIIGNSHGRELWNGLQKHFKDVYKSMTLFVRDYCMPFMAFSASREMRSTCEEYERELIQILRNWSEPIDIIVAGIEYFNFLDPIIANPISNDTYFNSMQTFFSHLNDIARDLVFVPKMHMDWNVEPFAQVLQKRLFFGQNLHLFQQRFQHHKFYLPNVQKRIELVQCSKCIKVEWSDAWCLDEMCSALDTRNISYFRDSKHINAYGSLIYGNMLRKLYNKHFISK